MKLRKHIAAALHARLVDLTPDAIVTSWGTVETTVAIEELNFVSDGGDAAGWSPGASFQGVVRSELKSNAIDDLDLSPLIVSLAQDPLHISRDDDTPVGEVGIACRAVLLQSRDVLRDTHVVTALRMKVQGTIWTRTEAPRRPEAMFSASPDVGPGNAGAYLPPADLGAEGGA